MATQFIYSFGQPARRLFESQPYVTEDVSLQILDYLSSSELRQAAQVNKTWKQMADTPLLWKQQCAREGMDVASMQIRHNHLLNSRETSLDEELGGYRIHDLKQTPSEIDWKERYTEHELMRCAAPPVEYTANDGDPDTKFLAADDFRVLNNANRLEIFDQKGQTIASLNKLNPSVEPCIVNNKVICLVENPDGLVIYEPQVKGDPGKMQLVRFKKGSIAITESSNGKAKGIELPPSFTATANPLLAASARYICVSNDQGDVQALDHNGKAVCVWKSGLQIDNLLVQDDRIVVMGRTKGGACKLKVYSLAGRKESASVAFKERDYSVVRFQANEGLLLLEFISAVDRDAHNNTYERLRPSFQILDTASGKTRNVDFTSHIAKDDCVIYASLQNGKLIAATKSGQVFVHNVKTGAMNTFQAAPCSDTKEIIGHAIIKRDKYVTVLLEPKGRMVTHNLETSAEAETSDMADDLSRLGGIFEEGLLMKNSVVIHAYNPPRYLEYRQGKSSPKKA